MQAHPLRPPFVTPRSMHPMSEMPQTLPAPSLAHPNTYSTFEYYSPFPSSTSFLHAPLVRPPSPSPPHPLSQPQVASSVVHSMESGDHGFNNGVDDATLDIGIDGSNGTGAIDKGMDDRLKVSSRKRSIGGKEKGKDNSRASQKQSKAKDRRQKLAEGEASTYRDHWSIDDFRVFANTKLRLDKEMTEARGKNQFLSLDERWRRVSAWCRDDKVNKASLQCKDKWENTFPKYKKIRDWDKAVPSGKNTFALMSVDERLEGGFPKSFDSHMYEILESRFGIDVLVDPGPILVDSSSERLG
ncbi:hypothetical protein L7F22_044517 [Adiantum nelumboides]|nr:hypothetical protein [Adiantum nelumboides]